MIENLFSWEVGALAGAIVTMALYFVNVHREKTNDAKEYAKDIRDLLVKSIESNNALAKALETLIKLKP